MGAVVVIGVAGSGKTTVAARLAAELGWRFVDADAYHPSANVDKMRAGIPLTDDDRWPWLATLADLLRDSGDVVMACSALRRAYRDVLRDARPDLRMVYLAADPHLIADRLRSRTGHYFPATLMRSQFQALQEPDGSEDALTVPADTPLDDLVERIATWLRRPASPRPPH